MRGDTIHGFRYYGCMQQQTPPPASPMRNFMIICVFLAAISVMNMNWNDGLTFWKQQANSATQGFSEQDVAFAKTITSLRDDQVLPMLVAEDRPTLLFIYASWCPYCRQQMPILKQLTEQLGDEVRLATLSLDKDARMLAKFLQSKPQPLWFDPLILAPRARDNFKPLMQQAGSNYKGAIPHIVVFDAQGNVKADFVGMTSLAALTEALQ